MLVKRSSMLPGNGTEVDWERLGSEVPELADLVSAVAAFGSKVPPAAATVRRWQELPTAALVALAQAGHRDAFDPLYRRYALRVLGYVRARLRNESAAEDVASRTWEAALEGIDRFQADDNDEGFARWLFAIARRKVVDVLRGAEWEFPAGGTTSGEVAVWLDRAERDSDDVAEDQAGREELRARLYEAVEGLTPQQRTVVRLRLDGAREADVVRETGWTQVRVANLWRDAQAAIRERVSGDLTQTDPAQLRAAAETLPARLRDVALMRLDGKTPAEIIRLTGRSRHACAAAWRDAQRALRVLLSEGFGPQATGEQVSPRALVQQELHRERLRTAAMSLPEWMRRVALLRLDGTRNCDVARALGQDPHTTASTWRRARAALARMDLTV